MELENKNKFLTNEGFKFMIDSIKNKIVRNVVDIEKIVVDEDGYGIATYKLYNTGIRYEILFEVNIMEGPIQLYTKKVIDNESQII